jgi:hypothetical protein
MTCGSPRCHANPVRTRARLTNGLGMLDSEPEGGRPVLSAQLSGLVRLTVVDRWRLSRAGRYGTRGARPAGSRTCSDLSAACRPVVRGEPVLGDHLAHWQGPQARGSCPVENSNPWAFGTTIRIAHLHYPSYLSWRGGELRFCWTVGDHW